MCVRLRNFFFYCFQVNVPKQRRTFCKKCKCHKLHKVTQYKKSKERQSAQGRRRYDRKQQGFGGQTKPIFRKKVNLLHWNSKLNDRVITDCVIFRQKPLRKLCYVWNVPNANSVNKLHWNDANISNWVATRNERDKWFSSRLFSILFNKVNLFKETKIHFYLNK